MKHFHILMAVIVIGLFLYQSFVVLRNNQPLPKQQTIIAHICLTLLIITGAVTLWPLLSLNVPLQWVWAKVILLVAAISASMKAFKSTTPVAQRKIGIGIAAIAYAAIVAFAFIKPDNLF